MSAPLIVVPARGWALVTGARSLEMSVAAGMLKKM